MKAEAKAHIICVHCTRGAAIHTYIARLCPLSGEALARQLARALPRVVYKAYDRFGDPN